MNMTKKSRRLAVIPNNLCVACGSCIKVCPKGAIQVFHGMYAEVDSDLCIGCGICKKICPASIIELEERL